MIVLAAALVMTLAPLAATRTDAYAAGPYTVTVTRQDPVDVDHAEAFGLALTPADGAGVVAITLPGPGTAARPGRATTTPGARPGVYVVTTSFSVRGAWVLAIDVSGVRGRGRAVVPVTVAAPGAIPQWLGWTIGLSPLAVLLPFLATQVRAARRLRLRESPAARRAPAPSGERPRARRRPG
jgi:hypothetical protein